MPIEAWDPPGALGHCGEGLRMALDFFAEQRKHEQIQCTLHLHAFLVSFRPLVQYQPAQEFLLFCIALAPAAAPDMRGSPGQRAVTPP